mmetsp:Transcript_31137/g.53250  ORF Transcript_31137/g.53250 Transcript_31137/m.53250 type:complete len:89 (-) Transcript_31137:693-959(-)
MFLLEWTQELYSTLQQMDDAVVNMLLLLLLMASCYLDSDVDAGNYSLESTETEDAHVHLVDQDVDQGVDIGVDDNTLQDTHTRRDLAE